jgi:hypothetical protein
MTLSVFVASRARRTRKAILEFAAPEEHARPGEEVDRFTVDEGVVKIAFPSGMTPASVEELEEFFKLFYQEGEAPCRSRNPKAKLTSSSRPPAT